MSILEKIEQLKRENAFPFVITFETDAAAVILFIDYLQERYKIEVLDDGSIKVMASIEK